MALLETPDIVETTATRGEIRRRKTPKPDSSLYDSSSSSSSSRTNSSDDGEEHIRPAADETTKEKTDNKKKGERSGVLQYTYRASSPAHRRIKESPLSSDAIFNQSHAGLFNLCIVVLVAVNGRLIIENLMKYGLLINSNFWFSSRSLRDWPLLMCCVSLLVFPFTAYIVEKLAWKRRISDPVVITLHVIITTTAILYPVFMILRFDSVVLSGVSLMLCACINWLKLTSFVHTNYDMRSLVNSIDKGDTETESVNFELFYDADFKSLVYFMLAPTLCYQISYPRTAFIRKGWVLRQLIKLIIFTGLMGFIIEQPVHKWIVRHLYFPCLRNGIPKGAAILVAFFMSAVFHELCIAVPCHIFKFWAFIGIMFQVPLVLLTYYLQNKFQNSMVGNIIFWCFFSILGQPMCVLLYYHDVMNQKVNSK